MERSNVKLRQLVSCYRRSDDSYKAFDLSASQKIREDSGQILNTIIYTIHGSFFSNKMLGICFLNECHPVLLFLSTKIKSILSVHKGSNPA
jgi:hypothetical protein